MCMTATHFIKGTFFSFLVMASLNDAIARLQQNDTAMTELKCVMFCFDFWEKKLTGGV